MRNRVIFLVRKVLVSRVLFFKRVSMAKGNKSSVRKRKLRKEQEDGKVRHVKNFDENFYIKFD